MLLNVLTLLAADPSKTGWYSAIDYDGCHHSCLLVIYDKTSRLKKQKNKRNLLIIFRKGDKIVTIAGIHGVVNKINEDGTLQLEVTPGSYLLR